MSIKKLFESNNKIQEFVSDVSSKDLFNEDGESFRNIEAIREDQKRYVPQIDYSKPENFVRYGSARLYYKSALSRITDYYPYDGSEAEINEFLNGCLDVERYILDNQYPRSTGYITFTPTYNPVSIIEGYGAASNSQYITFYGGPGTGSVTTSNLKDLMPNPKNSKYNYSNIYDESIYTTAGLPSNYGSGTRTSNLKSNFDDGVTVEFWLKTGSVDPATQASKQVVFDLFNRATDDSAGRMLITLTSSHAASGDAQRPFLITVQSGSPASYTTNEFLSLGQASLHSSSGDWNHYAIRLFNTGSNFRAQLYVNGYLNDTATRVPYDLASHIKPTTDGLAGWLSSSSGQERAWPHAIENDYSSAENLQGWWRLNTDPSTGTSGKECPDSSGHGKHGTSTNLPAFNSSQNPSDYVAEASNTFNGASVNGDRINIGTPATWNAIIGNNRPTDDGDADEARGMTFAAWIRKTGDGGGSRGRIIDFGDADIALYTTATEEVRFLAMWDGSQVVWTTAASAFSLNTWTHIAVTYDASLDTNDPIIYVNGVVQSVSVSSGTATGQFDGISGGSGFVGNRSSADRTFEGQLADVAVWDSVLLTNEIKSIYSAGTVKRTTHTVGELGPADLRGTIAALQWDNPGSGLIGAGAGPLSGSIDEFRFWKTKRSSKEIGNNWFTQVRGGVNSDISNTSLGVYFKFNEGITGDSDTDKIILDYAGRVTNGVLTNYNSYSRNTGSAIVSASAAIKEFLDPIIRTNHPDYISLQSRLLNSGTYYDYQNNTSILNLVPSWIVQEDDEDNNTDLRYITHVMGAYFDKLYLQIAELPKLRHQTHTSGTFKPIPFAEHLPQSLGLYSPEIFIDSTILEKFMNRSDKVVFEDDINDAKNMIYQNLYNNLTEIYKAKGTEQAIKNVLKCFNIDDKLLKLRVNSNNAEVILKNNLEQQLIKKNLLDFSKQIHNKAVVYQKRKTNVLSGIDTNIVAGCITGSTSQYGYGFTYEANVVFPEYDALNTINTKLRPNFTQMSLFGTVTTDGNITSSSFGTDTTATGNSQDYGNFKIYFVREEEESKSGYFKLVAANPDDSTITLTSSVFNDVYNNELWNLSVRVKPQNYPLDTLVHPFTGSYKYDVIFSGYNSKTTDLFNSFKVSTQVDKSTGQKYTETGKRVYVGADKVNVTGAVNYYSDVQISSVVFWTKYLQDTDLQQHALDLENIGLSGSIQYLNGLDTSSRYSESLNHKTLALNWNFRNLTGSDATGNFVVQDFSSGSQTDRNDYGWVGKLSGRYHTGYGDGFPVSSTNIVNAKRLNSYRFVDPERPVSSDMIQIFTDEDDLSPNLRREEILPNFVYSLEKSLYEAISQEMLDFFAGVIDFNDVIGHSVHYYRHRYKELEKLRQVFFRRVTEVAQVEKYTEYYKWFDDAITTIISQLIPASSEYINDIQNVIESHVLERNKYQNRLNIFDSDKFSIERVLPEGASMHGSPTFPGDADYVAASTSKESSPRPTNTHIAFWKTRADRSAAEITSGDPIIDAQRNKFRDVIYSNPVNSGAAAPPTLRKLDGTKYQPSNYNRKTQGYPLTLNVQMQDVHQGKNLNNARVLTRDIRGGVNFESAKNFDFAASITRPAGPINNESSKFVPLNVMLGFVSDSTKIPVFKNATRPDEAIVKQKKTFKVQTGRDWEEGVGYYNVKSNMAFPFNVYSASIEISSGYNAEVVSKVDRNLIITNLHNDVYGPHAEVPMQGPFTYNLVGGHQSRHVDFNEGSDQQNNRPEAWRILLGTCDIVPSGAIGVVGADYPPPSYDPPAGTIPYPYPHHEKAYLYRDHIAKRPVNIRNVNRLQNNKTVPGNFQEQYEVVHSFGAFHNARAFLDNQPTLPAQVADVKFTTNVRSIYDIKRTANSHVDLVDDYSTAYLTGTVNKTIVTTRFAAPGGIEVMSKGYLDFKSSEMTPYNSLIYRNQTVIKPHQGPSGSISEPVVYGGATNIQVSDIHNRDYGLRSHLARHSARFGRDSVATEIIEYNLNKAMHIGHPRKTYSTNTPSGWWRLKTDVSSTGNIVDNSGNKRDGTFDAAGDRPAFSTTLFPNEFIQEASCTFDGSDDAVNIGAGSLWQTIIGTGTGGTKKMTFSIWLRKTGDGGSNFGRIFGFGKDSIDGQIAIYTNVSEQIVFKTDWNGGTSNVWSTSAAPFSLNTWTHLAITYDANSTANDPIVYVNGAPVSFLSNPTPSGVWDGIASGENCYIGNDSLGSLGWEGQLADAGIWNTVLTADEIAALYTVGTLSDPSLIIAVNPSPPGETYNQLPSYHKINRNTRQVIKATDANNTTFITSSRFDNAFIVRPIPQSDRQYNWFSRSVVDVGDIKYAGYQNVNRGEAYNAFRTSSAGIEYYWTFISASSATTGGLYQPTTELNIIVNDPITASSHTLGFPSSADVSNYTNTDLVGNTPNANYLNQLLTSRKSTYGWGWRKFHQHNNKMLVNDRRANRMIIATGSDRTLSTHELRPISLKGRQSYINFDIIVAGTQQEPASKENVTLKFTNTNEKIFFNDLKLNNYFEFDYDLVNEPYRDALRTTKQAGTTLNWFLYKQNLFPSLKNEFGAFSSKRVGYDNKFWRDSRTTRTTVGNTLSSSLVGVPVSKSCWVLDAPENFLTRSFISGTRGSEIYNFNDSYFVQQPFVALTGVLAHNQNVPKAGILQNTYFSYYNIATEGGRVAMVTPAPLYARKHELGSPRSVVSPGGVKIAETGSFSGSFNVGQQLSPFAGEALWEANTQAGIVAKVKSAPGRKLLTSTESASVFLPSASNPWYNDYDDFNSELKLISKGYAVVPEYRMSEHVKDYFNYGINNKTKTNFLEIVGTNSSSANRNFYIDYSNSDFLENFLGIKRYSLLNAKEIKLTCNAAIKYNPYDGFYPAQRTVDLAAQFVDSFKNAFQGGFSGSSDGVTTLTNKSFGGNLTILERGGGISKLLLDPLISPGILYNSIKSGIAVDYPVISNSRKRLRRFYGTNESGSTNNWALTITGAATEDMIVSGTGQYLEGQYWDRRIPFEAIIEPRKYILNTNFIEMETHPSMSVDFSWNHYGPGLSGLDDAYEKESYSASFSNNADGIYTLMARNFFGACGEFFLQSSGITRLESNTVLNDLQFSKDDNFANGRPLYMARIKLRKSHNGARTYDKEFDSFNTQGALSYYSINGAKRTINGTQSVGEYALPQDPMHNSLFKETFTMYSRPTAFGPSCAGRPTGSNGAIMPFNSASKDSFSGYNPAFTPPYYDGEAWADLIFRPHVIDKSQASTANPEVYDLNRILNETTVVCWRFDSGEEKQEGNSTLTASMPVLIPIEKKQISNFSGVTPNNDNTIPSIYDGKRINVNSMQLTSSVNIFGTEKVLEQETDKFGAVVKNSNKPVGTKWIIQPKWETPMLNFNDEGIHPITANDGNLTLPTYGSASVPRGMWHQFGVIPDDPAKGIFLEISDIPEDWLRNHYEVLASDRETPYNGNAIASNLLDAQPAAKQNTRRVNLYKNVRSLSSLCGFDQTNSSIKLGELKDSFAVHEAIVAVPYVIEEVNEPERKRIPRNSKLRKTRKKFISIPKRRFAATREQAAGSAQGDSLAAAGESIRKLKQSLEKYVFPPEFDFLNNKEVDPIAMYVFEFKYEFDRDDLSYIWQNLAPRDSKEIKFQQASVAHNLANNELINEKVLMNDNLRWMVFKVKQRAQTDYYDLIPDQANESTRQVKQRSNKLKEYKVGFNWPYDYLSFVELIKMDVDILLK